MASINVVDKTKTNEVTLMAMPFGYPFRYKGEIYFRLSSGEGFIQAFRLNNQVMYELAKATLVTPVQLRVEVV